MESAEKRYTELLSLRDSFLKRARDASKLTIPTLIPEEGATHTTKFYSPYQSIGSRGVNNLASKLLLAILPPNAPFFRLLVDDFTLEELQGDEGLKTRVVEGLAKVERAVMDHIEATGDRIPVFYALKLLIVGGNALVYVGKDKSKTYSLDQYVVVRDGEGKVLEIVVEEWVSPQTIPDKVREEVVSEMKDSEKNVAVYTHVKLRDGKYHVYQEAKGKVLPDSTGSYPEDKSPFLALRWTAIDGEDYGRGFVEEYYGDLYSLEQLTKAIVQGSAAAAKVLFLVNPNGTTSKKTLSKSNSGDIETGNADDVSVLQLDKYADFRTALETIERIEDRLAAAFLLNSSIQRPGERVTAEEIRYMAGELEDALGGVYSILSQEFQLPFVNRKMAVLQRMNKLPNLPRDTVHPAIVTVIEAIRLGHDLRKLDLFIQGLSQVIGPEMLQMYMNVDDYITRRATAVGIDTKGLIKTKEQIEAERQQQMQAQAMQALGPQAIQAATKMMTDNGNGGNQNG